jgi:hypothetical protein
VWDVASDVPCAYCVYVYSFLHSNHHSLEPPLAPTTTRTDHHSH